ncbi:uncharacterized protein LOC117112755 [Anneissia japonica]|uniref:uncharacterized protein LOC117112755 n=1 Tax=Anneissia japonica TaxID=1529436 RepID=UPI00142552A9|nr:uncharacterized protein LOC117112755 [Anneissia japonica]
MFNWAKSSIYKIFLAIILLKCYTNASVEFIKAPSKTITAFPGESITIECVISGLTNDHIVEWTKGIDKDIVSQNHVILEDYKHSFTISQKQSDFSLSFKISTDNYENMDFYLSVLYNNEVTVLYSLSMLSVAWTIPAPICAKFLNGESASEGEEMRLMCQSSTVHEPDIYYGWSKNGEIVSPGRLVYNLYEFFISKSDHNAEFICTATKYRTGETRTCSVDTFTVNYAPTVLVRHKSALEYECEVDARPSTTPIWSIDPVIPLSSFNVEDYVTFFITAPDSVPIGATLLCTASNSEGVGSDIIKITKNEPTTIVPTHKDDARLTIPYRNKSRVKSNNMILIVGLVAGGFLIIAIIGIFMFGCCKKNSKKHKENTTQQTTASYNNREISNEVYESSQLESGTQGQRGKKDSPYEVMETNGSLRNGTSIAGESARNGGAPDGHSSTPESNSPKKSYGYTNVVLNMGNSMENGMTITPRTNSKIRSQPSARNTVYATTNEHLSAMLDKKPESRITYASVVPKSKRAGKENMTKSIHTDFRFSQAIDEEAKISHTKRKQDPRMGYAKVIPKSKRNTNMNNVMENTKDNCKEDTIIEDQELSTIKKQNLRFGYTNVIPASERKASENKRATVSYDFFINDKISTGTQNKHENDHNVSKNNKITTKHDYTVVIPKSKRTTHGDKENNCSINKSKESRISYAEIDFSSMKQNGKTKMASKEARVSYADIDFSHGNTRQNRKNYTPVIPKSQRNHDGMKNSYENL